MKDRSDVVLILLCLCSLLGVAAMHSFDTKRLQAMRQEQLSRWETQAERLTRAMRANYSFDRQLGSTFLTLRRRLALSPGAGPVQGTQVARLFRQALPPCLQSASASIYVMHFGENRSPQAVRGPGLASHSGAFLARILSSLRVWPTLNARARSTLNARLEHLFGDFLSADLLLRNAGGNRIDVVFRGRRCLLVWDFLRTGTRPTGALLALFDEHPDQISVLRSALIMSERREKTGPLAFLQPIESWRDTLEPVNAESDRRHDRLAAARVLIRKTSSYRQVASFAAAIDRHGLFLYRTSLAKTVPYELWLVGHRPEIDVRAVMPGLCIFLVLGWGSALAWRLIRRRPLAVSVRSRLLGLIVVVGGGPLVLLILFGTLLIEERGRQERREMVTAFREEVQAIDRGSSAFQDRFGRLVHQALGRPAFKAALLTEHSPSTDPAVARCFQDFASAGLALDRIGLVRFGRDERELFPPGAVQTDDRDLLLFFTPLMYGCLKHFSDEAYSAATHGLSETRRLGFSIYQLVTTSGLARDAAMMREKPFVTSFGADRFLFCYAFLSSRGRPAAAVTFRAPAAPVYAMYARDHLRRLGSRDPQTLFGLAEWQGDQTRLSLTGKASSQRLGRLLQDSLSSNAATMVQQGHQMMVSEPCRVMPRLVMGASLDLRPLAARRVREYRLLAVVGIALLIVLGTIAFGLTSFFLDPLYRIETGIRRLLEGDFHLRLDLRRDDEMGDVARDFDRMAGGLQEREHLARFVSGALTADLGKLHTAAVAEPRAVWGVVLASDIRDFTSLTETFPPEQIVSLLNHHLEAMSAAITAEGGLIDKFIGDAVIAVFHGDEPQRLVHRAVAAARAMMDHHHHIVRERLASGRFSYAMGIGIAGGEMFLGTFGSGDRQEFSVTGRPRHEAEELEAGSKQGRFRRIVVSAALKAYLPDVSLVPLPGTEGDNEAPLEVVA